MEKYYSILILSKNYQTSDSENLVLSDAIFLIDDTHLEFANQIYTFDYLIFTSPSEIKNFRSTNILHEAGIPVTNMYFQTTFENIYYTSDEKIEEAIQNIKEND